jgi:hypothetical protein
MYSFSYLAWELLSESKPFITVKNLNEISLAVMVHSGKRPDLALIPPECPPDVVRLIEANWSADRASRKSAIATFSSLEYFYGTLSQSSYDIFITWSETSQRPVLCSSVFHRFTQHGYRVYFNTHPRYESFYGGDGGSDFGGGGGKRVSEFIKTTGVFITLLSEEVLSDEMCMEQLREIRLQRDRSAEMAATGGGGSSRVIVIPLVLDANFSKWASPELTELCSGTPPKDLSSFAGDPSWNSEEGPNDSVLMALVKVIDGIVWKLRE